MNPYFAFALNNRASLRAGSGDIQGALHDIDRALRLHTDFPVALLNRDYLAAYLGDTADACRVWQNVASLGNSMAQDMVKRYCR
jgi:tetratricopeptide (TPR) repeat protein